MTDSSRFIQISTLTAYPASLLNRDDSGLSKRISFGGRSRTRISSQCLKRHWRLAEGPWSLSAAAPDIATSVRSRSVFAELIERPLMPAQILTADEAKKASLIRAASEAIQSELYGSQGTEAAAKKKAGKAKDEPADVDSFLSAKRSELVVLGHPEIRFLSKAVAELAAQSADSDDVKKKTAAWFKEHRKEFEALKCGAGLDAAMFGRFVSGDPDARVDAAVHVAHAFTVHEEESETDYFTAVDDLDRNGAGHVNAAELTTGLFYSYVVVDVPLLVSNTTGISAADWQKADRTVAARLVKHLVHLITTVSPGAKLGSTAPYAYSSFVLAEAGSEQPRTLANAFYEPVPLRGDIQADAQARLRDYIAACDAMYGCENHRWTAALEGKIAIPGAVALSVPALADALEQTILTPER